LEFVKFLGMDCQFSEESVFDDSVSIVMAGFSMKKYAESNDLTFYILGDVKGRRSHEYAVRRNSGCRFGHI
jgi:hypothetical protein